MNKGGTEVHLSGVLANAGCVPGYTPDGHNIIDVANISSMCLFIVSHNNGNISLT